MRVAIWFDNVNPHERCPAGGQANKKEGPYDPPLLPIGNWF